jgi:nitrite reductase/ring-hydroxylating ferredoxin subunit
MSDDAPSHTDHVVGALEDFPEGSHRVVEIAGRQVGIFNIGGELHGLPNVCPHQTGPVCEGKIVTGSLRSTKESGWRAEWVHDGEVIVCPWHGLEYHVPTGQCMAYPHIRLRRYDVLVEDGEVVVRIKAPKRRRSPARA